MSLLRLRDYQEETLVAVREAFDLGDNRQLIVLPTGSGKTIVMSAIAKHFNKRTLVLAHREELIQQAYDKIRLFWPEVDIGICMADRDEIDRQVVIGSVQTCCRPKRLEKLKALGFDVLMIDEAHHASGSSYQAVISELGFVRGSDKLLLGVTATPQRADQQALGDTFDKVSYSRSIGTMIAGGYLCPLIGRKILTSFLLQDVGSQNGDFVVSDLSEAVNIPERNAFVAEKYIAHASGRKGVAFCVDVKHCHDLVTALRHQGVMAEAVWGAMNHNERKAVLGRLKTGETRIVTSCGVLTEGFDEPTIDTILMARPTKSLGLYTQMVGRGLRLWPGKQNCLVLDFTDKVHKLNSVMALKCSVPEVEYECTKFDKNEQLREVDRTPSLRIGGECDTEIDLLGCAKFLWISIGEGAWSLADDDRAEIVMSPLGDGYIANLFQVDGSFQQIVKDPLPLEYCSGVCEDYARKNLKLGFADADAVWMNTHCPATEGQVGYLQRLGCFKVGLSKVQASMEIRKLVAIKNRQRRAMAAEPATAKQLYALRCYGVQGRNMSKLEARQAIAAIKREERIGRKCV